MVTVAVLRPTGGGGVPNFALSVIFSALSQIVHTVLLVMANVSNVFPFSG